jgi:hypothetical protein
LVAGIQKSRLWASSALTHGIFIPVLIKNSNFIIDIKHNKNEVFCHLLKVMRTVRGEVDLDPSNADLEVHWANSLKKNQAFHVLFPQQTECVQTDWKLL